MSRDFFEHKAKSYEQVDHRVANVENIARSILSRIDFQPDMEIMDFGSGTGLLLEKIAPSVRHISAVDISKSMNQQLADKRPRLGCELDILEMDLTTCDLDRKFDGIISSMTLHHVEDIPAIFKKFRSMLNPNGFLALADLETEDGSFHTEDTGVFHFGFDPEQLVNVATSAGFKDVAVTAVSTVHKPQKDYPVLLLTATV